MHLLVRLLVQLLIPKLEPLLRHVLERKRIERPEVLEDDLVERLVEEQDLIPSRVEFLDEGRFEEVGGGLTDTSEEEDLARENV